MNNQTNQNNDLALHELGVAEYYPLAKPVQVDESLCLLALSE